MNSTPPQTIRAFIAINLPAEVLANLKRLQLELKSLLTGDAVRWTPPEQIHLTLKFLGQVKEDSVKDLQTALQRACEGTSPFALRAETAGFFPSAQRPRVLWIGIEGSPEILRRLHERIESETSSWGEREEREFAPHLTLARVKHLSPRAARTLSERIDALTVGKLGGWRVESVELMQSKLSANGATHIRLATFPLES